MISDAIALYELLTKKWKEYKVISAFFNWKGNRRSKYVHRGIKHEEKKK